MVMPMSSRFERHFEGAEILDGLLELAGSALDSNEVLARLVAGHEAGVAADALIPTLFDGEPRFPSPEVARRLYQNLLGLWDLVRSGRKVELEPTARPPRPKKEKPTPPPPFDPQAGPSAQFVEAAWRYLEELPEGDPRALERLTHVFENRHDALVQWLDEAELPEPEYQTLRYLLFELSAMLELGWPHGVRGVRRDVLEAAPHDGAELPAALRAWVEEALAESDLEEDARLKGLAWRGLHALWAARQPPGRS
jgi:hypothetical protein